MQASDYLHITMVTFVIVYGQLIDYGYQEYRQSQAFYIIE